MPEKCMPQVFAQLLEQRVISEAEIINTADGFFVACRSVSSILAQKGILDFLDSAGERHSCSGFFDDWFLYAVSGAGGCTYSLLKLREQEHDAQKGDGDMPGVTISFIAFSFDALVRCLDEPSDENRSKLSAEINRVVAHRGQRHHDALKHYFVNPRAQGAYLVAQVYTQNIAALARDGALAAPDYYRELAQRAAKNGAKAARLPSFVAAVNREAGYTVCDHERIYIRDPHAPTAHEIAVILATHTGNTSVYSFAAEVEYHARFLTPLARLKLPFIGSSVYDSAIRADMTVGDKEFSGPAPFYRADSAIVRRQMALHTPAAAEEHERTL